jgi:DnaK suppressor protein
MFVSILQLMGFPMGKPVHSRAGEDPPQQPAKGRGGKAGPTDQAREISARRLEVNAKSGKDSKAQAAKSTTKAAAATKAKPAGAAAKPVPKAVVKPAAKADNTSKSAAKPPTKTAEKAKPITKAPPSSAAKPAAKPVKTDTKSASSPTSKSKVAASAAQEPVSKAPAKPMPTTVSSKPKSPVSTDSQPVEKNTAASAAPASATTPAKAGRPSSRLAQVTVPSMAQSVASTAAKASYDQSAPAPIIVPALPSAIKKDPKLANNWKTTAPADLTDAELMAMPDSEYMNSVQLAAFRLKLTKLKLDILNSAGETTEHLREDTSVVPDPADRATIEEEHALELRTRDRERKLLKKIEQSIGRIDAGDYGYCDETGEPIGVGRLLARPTATLSLEAQQRRELKQKMFGD